MIRSKADLVYYLRADRLALGRADGRSGVLGWFAGRIFPDYVWRFQKLLRRLELHTNLPETPWRRLRRRWVYFRFHRLSARLGFSIPPNVFGPGLSIAHHGTIIVNKYARVGANCRLHACVNIGTSAGSADRAPQIGDNVYIGPGAVLYGDIRIADGVAVGANAVVNHSCEEPNVAIAGVPARSIGAVDTTKLLVRATELLPPAPVRENARGAPAPR